MNPKDLIAVLNDLIETCKDGEYGFRACAEQAASKELATLFSQRAAECQQAATELQQHVSQLGGKPDTSGSLVGALHRGWVAIRSTLTTYDDHAVLEECERGEDIAVASYRKALENPIPEPERTLIERQYEGAKRNHDQIRSLRNSYK